MTPAKAARLRIVLAFAAIYLIWGSTYLGIKIAIETVPPFFMAGARSLIAGAILLVALLARGVPAPPPRYWAPALLIGGLLLLGGNGGVTWSQQRLPSGLAALIVSFVPVWMLLMEWLRRGGTAPSRGTLAGVGLGLVGLALLIGPGRLMGGAPVDPVGAGVLVFATLSWAAGSLVARHRRVEVPPLMATAMQMIAGGGLLVIAGLVAGEAPRFHPAAVSLRSALAMLYLIGLGSLVGYTAYVWLLAHAPVAKVATYAFVNPVVAVALGWAFAGETLSPRVLVAATIIVTAVAIITLSPVATGPKAPPQPAPIRLRGLSGSPGK